MNEDKDKDIPSLTNAINLNNNSNLNERLTIKKGSSNKIDTGDLGVTLNQESRTNKRSNEKHNEPNSLSLSVNNTIDREPHSNNNINNSNNIASPSVKQSNIPIIPNSNNRVSSSKQKNDIINQVKFNKMVQEEAKRMEEVEKEEKRVRRMRYVKEELEKLKDKKKEKEQRRLDVLSEERKKKEEKQRKKIEAEAQLRIKIKEELEKVKRMKQHEEKQKVADLKKRKLDIAKQKKSANEAFFVEQADKLKKEFGKMTDERKLNEQKKLVDQEFQKLRLIEDKKKFDEFFEEEKKVRNVERQLHSDIESLNFLEEPSDNNERGLSREKDKRDRREDTENKENREKNERAKDNNRETSKERKEQDVMGRTGYNRTSDQGFRKGDSQREFFSYRKNKEYTVNPQSPFYKFNEHIKLVYDIYAKTLINPKNEISMDDFQKFCNNFNILGLLLNHEEVQYIFKRIAYNQDKTDHIRSLNLKEFSQAMIYLCLFSIDNFADVTEQNKLIIGDPLTAKVNYYQKINKSKQELMTLVTSQEHGTRGNIEAFFEFLEFTMPFDKRELENYINIQKNMNHMEKNLMLKNKSENLPLFNSDVRNLNQNEGKNNNIGDHVNQRNQGNTNIQNKEKEDNTGEESKDKVNRSVPENSSKEGGGKLFFAGKRNETNSNTNNRGNERSNSRGRENDSKILSDSSLIMK
mmetsp:Transcript_19441/g.20216  ORF Transcript_19441/g.20216 Transcript_19441/m.20216 type:complete len:692 (+) Transcript_19441:582-2657(+)